MRFCDIYAEILVGGVRGMFENCNLWKRDVHVKCEVSEERIVRIFGTQC
jgi:hypothetical protein